MTDTSATDDGRARLLDAAIAFGLRVTSAALVFVLQVFLARVMQLGEYGGYVTMWTWLVMLGAFAPLGFAESAVRFLPRYRARGRHGSANAFWRFGLRTVLLASLAMAGTAIIIAIAGGLEQSRIGLTALLLAAGLPFLAVQNFLEGTSRAHGWFKLTSIPIYVLRPLLIMAGCAALLLTGYTLNLMTVGAVVVAAMALVTLLLFITVSRSIRNEPQPANGEDITGSRRVWFKASLPLMLVSGVEDLLIYTDVLLLGALLGPEDVSVYFAAARAMALANFVYYAFYFVSARGFSVANALADKAKLQETVWATTRATFWFTALAVAATLIAGPWLLMAFGPAFEAGYPVMVILGLGLVARGLSGQSAELLITMGQQRHILVAGMTALGFNVALSLILIPHFGVTGAAWATAAAMAVRAIMLCISVRRACDLSVVALGFPSLKLSAAN